MTQASDSDPRSPPRSLVDMGVGSVRVLHVIPFVLAGGVERRRVLLARYLPSQYVQEVACFTGRGAVYDELRATGVPVHDLSYRGGGLRDISAHIKIHQLIRRYRPHVVHAAILPGMIWGGLAGLLQRVPVVLLEETSCPDRTAPGKRRRSRVARLALKALVRSTAGIVAVAPAIRDFLVDDQGVPAHKVYSILNGVEKFQLASPEAAAKERKRYGIPHGAFVLGNACRLDDEHKRISDLLDAVRELRARHDVWAFIVGDGRDRLRLERLAQELGIANAVVFAGRREDRGMFYAMMDAFVLSSATEAAPLGLMEAMMAARPCVATTVGGVPDIADGGHAALLVPPGRAEELAAAIERLVVDGDLRATLSSRASAHAATQFVPQRYARDVGELYARLVARSRMSGDSH